IQTRTDRLSDLGEQLVFLGAALGVVHDHVIFEREPDLQGQADQQLEIGGAKQVALRMREQDYAEVVFPRLQANRGGVADIAFDQRLAELLEAPPGKCRQRLGHLEQVRKGYKAAAAIG